MPKRSCKSYYWSTYVTERCLGKRLREDRNEMFEGFIWAYVSRCVLQSVDKFLEEEREKRATASVTYGVSLALGLEAGGWGALVERTSGGSGSLLGHGGFAGLAGLARRCGVCLATFPSAWLLERHALLQHAGQASDDKPFTCEQCGQRYRYRSAYVKHREQNHRARLPADKLFTCDVCGMQFRYLKSFKKHRLNHALERLQRAPEPQSSAMSVLARSSHEVDRRERRFACPFCGKCVRSKENLKLHVRKHTGERPFVCLFCGRAFGGKSDLTRHLRIHTGERPYHCEMCGKCFARADYLSKHLTTHIHQR
ncbi:Zinc finger protein 91 [Melipona quadrifasciata]|uniref:Zinc finger protein 91 n=1 Tax=Melipona quadrifasciata TaxID=166423 RepID=A0A0M8ZXN7_9HYME|nr:Zinc finger protein 91 [Melipona quadrifasciata]